METTTGSPASESSEPVAAEAQARGAPPLEQRSLAARTFLVLSVALAFGLAVVFIYSIRQVIAWLLVAILLAVALEPAVSWLTGHRWKRPVAALVVSLLFFLIMVGVLAGLTAPFIAQAKELITNLPDFVRDLFRSGPLKFLDTRFHIIEQLKNISFKSVVNFISGGSGSILSALSKGASLAFTGVTVLALMVMLLIEGPRAWGGFLGFFGPERRAWVDRLGARLAKAVGGYVQGNLFISVIAATVAYIAMLVLGVPFPLPLALLVGILDIIPLVGATIAAVVCVGVGFTQGWLVGVVLIGYFVVYQLLENNFIQPVVYARTVSLSPLIVLVASLIGAFIAGVIGVLVAIPLASAVFILLDEYRSRRGAAGSWDAACVSGPVGGILEGGAAPRTEHEDAVGTRAEAAAADTDRAGGDGVEENGG